MRFLTLRVFVLLRRLTVSADKTAASLARIADACDVLVAASQPKARRKPPPATFDTLDISAAESRWRTEKERMEQGLEVEG